MTNYAVFLRGINVGGIKIKMADLRQALAALPLANASTLLATGNIVCSFDGTAADLKSLVEQCLRAAFGYEARVIVLPSERLAAVVEACPYPAESKEQHTYITLASDPAVLDELYEATAAVDPQAPQQRLGPEATAWLAPVGGTVDSPAGKVAAKPRYKSTTTTRNLRTMLKVRDALAKL
jgi:uncharacterized protein (DUF1697 family)